MCGIFAYVSQKPQPAEKVLEGLKILEYRGYDSWGIAVKQKTKIGQLKTQFIVDKHVGKIGSAVLSSQFSVLSSLAIGHTRWATHGGVVGKNAHPHLDCTDKIAVVHNGIVENYEVLKKDLLKKGHNFLSETDSEIISHLIEEFLKSRGFVTAVRDAFNKLSGMNAVVVAYTESGEIVAAKNGSPLVIGEAKDVFYIASDASSILPLTKRLLFLEDNEMAILGKNAQLLSLSQGKKQATKFETISWKTADINMGKYPHFMLKEIHDQPKVLRNIAHTYESQVTDLAATIEKAKGTFFIGAGTASYAALSGNYYFSKVAGVHVNMSFASEFTYLLDFINKRSLIIALSQSGETIDVVEPLTKAKEKGATIASLVNTQGSTIYRMSDKKLLLGAGTEQAVASTKAYTAKTALLLMIAYALKANIKSASKQVLRAATEIERIVNNKRALQPVVNVLNKSEHVYIIGRGASYPTSLEAALKIKECSYVHAEGLAGGELKHGALALISKGTPCIVFAPNDETYEAIISNATEIKTRGGVIIGISHKNHSVFDHWIEVKDVGDATTIAQIVPIQLVAYFLALKKGYDPDKPRNLAKSVTVK